MPPLVLEPPMAPGPPPDWSGSLWVGSVDMSSPVADRIALVGADGYRRARLLVRHGRQPRGFVEVDVRDSSVSADELRRHASALPAPSAGRTPEKPPPVSVVLCTRDRAEPLRAALTSLLALQYPRFEIVVVDNASATEAPAGVVASIGDPRVRLVKEPRPGLARARNRGILAASHDIVAFTDDDVVVDRWWLWGLIDGFAAGADVACVCGMVASAELRSFPQAYFAVRRRAVATLGGFDEALGVGSQTRGGEDIDMFVRVLLAGHQLVYQPSALVWHRHRADMGSLHEQISGYGLGLGAWITKLMCDRQTARMVLQRSWRGVRHARRMTRVSVDHGRAPSGQRAGNRLRTTELWALARGPLAYARARLSGARKAPLRRVADNDSDRARTRVL